MQENATTGVGEVSVGIDSIEITQDNVAPNTGEAGVGLDSVDVVKCITKENYENDCRGLIVLPDQVGIEDNHGLKIDDRKYSDIAAELALYDAFGDRKCDSYEIIEDISQEESDEMTDKYESHDEYSCNDQAYENCSTSFTSQTTNKVEKSTYGFESVALKLKYKESDENLGLVSYNSNQTYDKYSITEMPYDEEAGSFDEMDSMDVPFDERAVFFSDWKQPQAENQLEKAEVASPKAKPFNSPKKNKSANQWNISGVSGNEEALVCRNLDEGKEQQSGDCDSLTGGSVKLAPEDNIAERRNKMGDRWVSVPTVERHRIGEKGLPTIPPLERHVDAGKGLSPTSPVKRHVDCGKGLSPTSPVKRHVDCGKGLPPTPPGERH
eukprot:14530101-Ditylum_brightwellii.AAC.1